jgi:thiosulfate reductase cytochrome b subunit
MSIFWCISVFALVVVIILSPLLVISGLRAWRDVQLGTPSTFSIWFIRILNFISFVFLILIGVGIVINTGRWAINFWQKWFAAYFMQ